MNKENRFNDDYKKFYQSVLSIIPSDNIWNPTLPETKEEQLDFFVKEWYPHMIEASSANYSYFKDNKISPGVFVNLDFFNLMNILNDKNRIVVWEYIHSLFIHTVSNTYVKNKYKDNKTDNKLLLKIKETFNIFPELVGNMVSWKRNIRNSQKKENKKKNPFNETFLENSKMAKLAKEITEEIDIANITGLEEDMKNIDNPMKILQLLMSGDSKNKGLGKLIETICNKLKTRIDSGEVSQEELLQEATSLLGKLGKGDNKDNADFGDISSIINMVSSLSGGGGDSKMPNISEMLKMMQNLGLNDKKKGNNMPDMSELLNMAQNLSGLNEDDDDDTDLSGVMNMLGDLKNVRNKRNTGKNKKINRKIRRKLQKKLKKKNRKKKK